MIDFNPESEHTPAPFIKDLQQNKFMSQYPVSYFLKTLVFHIKHNGWRWTFCFCWRHFFHGFLFDTEKYMQKLEKKYDLPGGHSTMENSLKWNNFDWESGKESWTPSAEWKAALVKDVMLNFIPKGKTILEIGPGAGRWTEHLQKISSYLYVVDVSTKCIELTKKRFASANNMEFFVNDGTSLKCIPDNSIDFIWSFDVFVHIKSSDVDKYLREFKNKLTHAGVAIIHHPTAGKTDFGWRSDMTKEVFNHLIDKYEFKRVANISAWGPDGQFTLNKNEDIISVFQK